ncbi:MAG: hypothetical protein IPP17_15390 [Bacteroidetes bacterium]|nr:hypothetical protein [Bacteroidota bacterium]
MRYIVFANKRHQTVESSECEPNQLYEDNGILALRDSALDLHRREDKGQWNDFVDARAGRQDFLFWDCRAAQGNSEAKERNLTAQRRRQRASTDSRWRSLGG